MSVLSLVFTPEPERLSRRIRASTSPLVRNRRTVFGLSLLSATSMAVAAAYQIGAIAHVPEPPLPRLDADTVDASPEAYRFLSTGDAFIGFVSYGTTMLLAGIGGPRRHVQHPMVPLALAGKAAVDAAQALRLTHVQWRDHRAFCSWCLLAAASTVAVLPFVTREARAAVRALDRAGRES